MVMGALCQAHGSTCQAGPVYPRDDAAQPDPACTAPARPKDVALHPPVCPKDVVPESIHLKAERPGAAEDPKGVGGHPEQESLTQASFCKSI